MPPMASPAVPGWGLHSGGMCVPRVCLMVGAAEVDMAQGAPCLLTKILEIKRGLGISKVIFFS